MQTEKRDGTTSSRLSASPLTEKRQICRQTARSKYQTKARAFRTSPRLTVGGM
ncbi:hypothetical protein COLSTE_02014 [Collinsella stercoris DSM 13279]|uniref:Uncharacterized protein n=1 Tax=Collinsella stercoris DSM 13279 TaxID=445975 RepID=B6GD37_9ACTN|nr:hypothetical protein COLSTE_02014 [Collinsella stercoris DSM 13279]